MSTTLMSTTPTFELTVSTTVMTSLTIPLSVITSVLASAESALSSNEAKIETDTNTGDMNSLNKEVSALSASVSYYSILGMQATATDKAVIASLASDAAVASAVSEQIYEQQAFLHGNKPSKIANLVLSIIFLIFFVLDIVFGIRYGQWWFTVAYGIGLLLECVGYASRVWLYFKMKDMMPYVIQYGLLTFAPCFLMAGIYYILSQLTVIMGKQYSILKPRQYTVFFIICDVFAILLQAAGGGLAARGITSISAANVGKAMLVTGLAVQVASMTIFQIFWYIFLKRCRVAYNKHGDAAFEPEYEHVRQRRLFKVFFPAISLSVLFVYVRSIYRLIELSQGYDSKLTYIEIYFLLLDSLMIALSALLLTICNPGLVYGRNANIKIKGSRNAQPQNDHDAVEMDRPHKCHNEFGESSMEWRSSV